MKVLKGNITNLDSAVASQLVANEKILKKFQVLPLDIPFEKLDTCCIYLSDTKLFITYDQIVEIYNLKDLVVDKMGAEPNFKLYEVLVEGNYDLKNDFDNAMKALKQSEALFKLSIYEVNTVPRDFILTSNGKTARNYQTWGMYQIIKNVRNEGQYNPILDDLVKSSFTDYNPTLLLRLMTLLGLFVALKLGSSFFYNFWISLFVNILLGSFLIYMSYRVIILYVDTLKKFERVYVSYKV